MVQKDRGEMKDCQDTMVTNNLTDFVQFSFIFQKGLNGLKGEEGFIGEAGYPGRVGAKGKN